MGVNATNVRNNVRGFSREIMPNNVYGAVPSAPGALMTSDNLVPVTMG